MTKPSIPWMNEWKWKKPSILWMWIWKIYPSHEWMNEWKWKSIHPMNRWMKMKKHPSNEWMNENGKNHPSIQSISVNDRIMNRNDQNPSILWMNETHQIIHLMNEGKWPNHPSCEWILRNGVCSFGRPVSPIPPVFHPLSFSVQVYLFY